jgi:phthalate 4,5-dioxygenase reductase subunit
LVFLMAANPKTLRVLQKDMLTPDIAWFKLGAMDGQALAPFTPGAHLSVVTPSGQTRAYSLCSDPHDLSAYALAIKREASGHGASKSMVDLLEVGHTLEVKALANYFELAYDVPEYIFVAGGIGITPILSMMLHLQGLGEKRFKLYFCTRSTESTPFLDLFTSEPLASHVHLHHDQGLAGQQFDFWPLFEVPKAAHIYCCGPQVLMDGVKDMTGHWPSEHVHFESFGAVQVAPEDNETFEVVLAKSGQRLTVPKDQSILEVLRLAGVPVPSSCESGTCGSCRTPLLSGEVDHRDFVLMDDEQSGQIMVCVSRAKGPSLVLDL